MLRLCLRIWLKSETAKILARCEGEEKLMQEQSTLEENKALVRRWYEEVWNKGRAEAIDEMLAADGIAHGLTDDPAKPLKGPADFKPFHEMFRGAFADIESDC